MHGEWIRVLAALVAFVVCMYGLCLAMDFDDAELLADLADVDVYEDDRREA